MDSPTLTRTRCVWRSALPSASAQTTPSACAICSQTVETLESIRRELFRSFTENARKKIYQNIGMRLVSHLKKVVPSKSYFAAYSEHLEVDMSEYQDFLKKLENPAVLESFEVLRKLARILSTPSNMVETYIETSKLNSLENKETIEQFIKCASLSAH